LWGEPLTDQLIVVFSAVIGYKIRQELSALVLLFGGLGKIPAPLSVPVVGSGIHAVFAFVSVKMPVQSLGEVIVQTFKQIDLMIALTILVLILKNA
jgi:hypothetical protein